MYANITTSSPDACRCRSSPNYYGNGQICNSKETINRVELVQSHTHQKGIRFSVHQVDRRGKRRTSPIRDRTYCILHNHEEKQCDLGQDLSVARVHHHHHKFPSFMKQTLTLSLFLLSDLGMRYNW
jgi:hypothetical protein